VRWRSARPRGRPRGRAADLDDLVGRRSRGARPRDRVG
jgi:hypothetical protein